MVDLSRKGEKSVCYACYGLLIANSAFFLYLLLSQESVWDSKMLDREIWLRKFFALLLLVVTLYSYSIFTAIRSKWFHSLSIYGGLTAFMFIELRESHASEHYALPVLSLIATEIVTFHFLRSSPRKAWYRHFAIAHVVTLPIFLGVGVFLTAWRPHLWDDKIFGWVLPSLIFFYFFNLLNLALAKLLQSRREFWIYACAVAESVLFTLLSLLMATIAGLG